ncbi:hypothetical protein BDN72DRAFT_955849 [Pluteus cervinus]|uniref:Uncharacterized protein n=1 Tax=Pluteus cervinus TaxID=181527 RepID=A0ACD3B7C6_9AGAR|nr:hypothetical protein BDN72DRAFT_955849 [Pluteus cervinus]
MAFCFPPEVECMIFEIAARSAELCVVERINLLLVSKRTQHWVESIIYRTSIYTPPSGGSLHLLPKDAAPPVPSSKLHFVRHLHIVGIKNSDKAFIRSMLLECRKLTILSLLTVNGPCATLIFHLILEGKLPNLERLSINMRRVSRESYSSSDRPIHLIQQVLSSLTHLELLGDPPYSRTLEMCSFLGTYLPNLTHLCLLGSSDIPPSIVTTILSSSLGPKLKVFAITRFHLERSDTLTGKQENIDRYEEIGVDDIRLVCLKQEVTNFVPDYLSEARGSSNGAWEFVEDIIEERKKKTGRV